MACARSRRDGPSPSVSRMLRDTSTRIGSRLLFAADGGTTLTGLSRIAISSISVSARKAINIARVPAPSGVGMRV